MCHVSHPGVRADFFAWPVVAWQPIEPKSEEGDAVAARVVVYQRGRDAVAVVWLAGDFVALDPRPTTMEPDRIDESLVASKDLIVRMRPEAPCQWCRHRQGT